MCTQEPEGDTIVPRFSKISMNRRAATRASRLKPELNAGCPQQVWSVGQSSVQAEPFQHADHGLPHLGPDCVDQALDE